MQTTSVCIFINEWLHTYPFFPYFHFFSNYIHFDINERRNIDASDHKKSFNDRNIEFPRVHNHDLWRFSSIMKIMIFYAYFIVISFYWKEKIVNRSLQSYENSQFWFQISINATNIKQIILEVLNYIYIYGCLLNLYQIVRCHQVPRDIGQAFWWYTREFYEGPR